MYIVAPQKNTAGVLWKISTMHYAGVRSGRFKVRGARGKTKKGPSDDVIILSQQFFFFFTEILKTLKVFFTEILKTVKENTEILNTLKVRKTRLAAHES